MTGAQHAAHLDAEQLEGDRLEELGELERDLLGLPDDAPASPEDEETFPPDLERSAA